MRAVERAADAPPCAPRRAQQAEDRFLLEPTCEWHPAACEAGSAATAAPVPFSLYGVFDGHGGKAAAEACVARMLPELLAALVRFVLLRRRAPGRGRRG